jgi:DNA-binding protein
VYKNENEIAANNKPTMTYIASEAKKYMSMLLQKVSLTGRDQDIKELNSILAK